MASLRQLREIPVLQRMPTNAQEWRHFMNELAKWVSDAIELAILEATVAQHTVDIADTQADVVIVQDDVTTNNVAVEGQVFTWWSDPTTGTAPAGDPIKDLVVIFRRKGTIIATRTVRGTLASATGLITLSNVGSTGDTTSISPSGSGTSDAKYIVTHADSGIIGKAAWAFSNISAPGGSPSK